MAAMPRPFRLLLTGALLLTLAACGTAAAPTPAPPPPTVAPSPTTAPSPTIAPSPTAVPASPTAAPIATARPLVPAATAAPGLAVTPPAGQSKPAGTPSPAAPPMMGASGFLSALKFAATEAGAKGSATGPSTELGRTTKAAMTKVSSFRLKGDATIKDEGKLDLLLEYAAPDRLHLSVEMDTTAVAKPAAKPTGIPDFDRFSMIVIGKVAYINLGTGWIKGDDSGDDLDLSLEEIDFGAALGEALDAQGFTRKGQETVNGEPCDVYVHSEDGMTASLWISTRDGFPRKLQGGDGEVQVVLEVTDINKPIEIKAPV
jgi:hypothetical protein